MSDTEKMYEQAVAYWPQFFSAALQGSAAANLGTSERCGPTAADLVQSAEDIAQQAVYQYAQVLLRQSKQRSNHQAATEEPKHGEDESGDTRAGRGQHYCPKCGCEHD